MPSAKGSKSFLALSESDIQIQVADWLRLYEPVRDFIFLSIPNEGKDRKNIARLMKLIRMGLRPGAGDILIVKAGLAYFLEIKTEDGVQSADQLAFEGDIVYTARAKYGLAHSFEEAQKIVKEWGIIA